MTKELRLARGAAVGTKLPDRIAIGLVDWAANSPVDAKVAAGTRKPLANGGIVPVGRRIIVDGQVVRHRGNRGPVHLVVRKLDGIIRGARLPKDVDLAHVDGHPEVYVEPLRINHPLALPARVERSVDGEGRGAFAGIA